MRLIALKLRIYHPRLLRWLREYTCSLNHPLTIEMTVFSNGARGAMLRAAALRYVDSRIGCNRGESQLSCRGGGRGNAWGQSATGLNDVFRAR